MSRAWTIAGAFDLGGPVIDVRVYGRGLINDTYLVTTAGEEPRKAILQRINRRVFPEPRLVMENLQTLLHHIHRRQAKAGRAAHDLRFAELCATRDRRIFFLDGDGDVWRTLSFIDHAHTIEAITDLRQAEEVGFALGRFHNLVSDLHPERLRDTLRGFHITPRYLARFMEVASRPKRVSPSSDLRFCFDFIEARRQIAEILEHAKRNALLPIRPVHGDPKLDNILFDERSGRAVSLIDLDTVQTGLIQYDIGDCLRSCCNRAGESPDDATAARFDLDICRAILKSYFDETHAVLTEHDYRYLYDAIRLIPFELGVRFVTDYLEGDKYFKTDDSEQNLRRALTQFQLTADIERNESLIRSLTARLETAKYSGPGNDRTG